MRLPRMTTRWLIVLVGVIAVVLAVTIEVRRTLNRRKRDHHIASYSQMGSKWLEAAERAQAKASEFAEMEHNALELVRTGEMTTEAGQKRGRQRRRQRESWEVERDRCMEEARWCEGRMDLLRLEAASGAPFDFESERRMAVEHHKKNNLAIKNGNQSPNNGIR